MIAIPVAVNSAGCIDLPSGEGPAYQLPSSAYYVFASATEDEMMREFDKEYRGLDRENEILRSVFSGQS